MNIAAIIASFTVMLASLSEPTDEQLVVIAHRDAKIEVLTKVELIDIYMGRLGSKVKALDLENGSELKQEFYRLLINRSEAQVQAYWSKLLFSARAVPPQQLSDGGAILQAVENNPAAIGYVQRKHVTHNVRVVYAFEADKKKTTP
jgi:ABC-type phosphate transport system substrate-binding protein